MASFVRVHHLDLAPDGNAAWFVEGVRDQVLAVVRHLEAVAGPKPMGTTDVRCRPVSGRREAPITRRQFEALATAVSLGYYEIPHRLDLRALAARTGLSLGSISELLRRAEAAVLTHYIDSRRVGWPFVDGDMASSVQGVVPTARHGNLSSPEERRAGITRGLDGRPGFGPRGADHVRDDAEDELVTRRFDGGSTGTSGR